MQETFYSRNRGGTSLELRLLENQWLKMKLNEWESRCMLTLQLYLLGTKESPEAFEQRQGLEVCIVRQICWLDTGMLTIIPVTRFLYLL